MEVAPRYTHDCNACRFITAIYIDGEVRDAYVCTGQDESVVFRYGDDGPDYSSYPLQMVTNQMMSCLFDLDNHGVAVPGERLLYLWVRDEAIRRGHIKLD